MTTDVVYEISFSVRERDPFEERFPALAVECSTHQSVVAFRVYRGVDGSYTRLRILIAFEEYYGWRWFTQLDTYKEITSLLQSTCTDVRTSLWTTSGVSLSNAEGSSVGPISDAVEATVPRSDRPAGDESSSDRDSFSPD